MRYQIQYRNTSETRDLWDVSATNPPIGSFLTRGEAALALANRLAREDCMFDFRIREVLEPAPAGENKIDKAISESESAVDRVGQL